jgi:DNA-binding beta-propeller fold protein YncE
MTKTRRYAPDFPGALEWFGVDQPVELSVLRGRVVLLDVGTFSSPAYPHSLSGLRQLRNRFHDELVILCVHVPAFPAERRSRHVLKAVNRLHVPFPVINDAREELCRLYGITGRPARVLIDREGCLVGTLTGTGKLSRLEQVIAHQLDRQGGTEKTAALPIRLKQNAEPRSELCFPGRLVVARDRIYLSDAGHHRVLVTSLDGHVLRQYGGEGEGFIDGEGGSAAFSNPQGMAIADEFLFVADTGNHALRRINLRTDEVVTLAGNGKPAGQFSGPGTVPAQSALHSPADVVYSRGRLFISMTGMHQIWSLSLLTNTLEMFSGCGREGLQDGPPDKACFAQPGGMTVSDGRLYVVDATTSAVRCLNPDNGHVSTLVGDGLYSCGNRDGRGTTARLQFPLDIASDAVQGMLWVSDTYNNRIRRIGINSGVVSSILPGRPLDEPGGLAFDGNTLYIANTNAHEVLRVNPDSGLAEALNVIEEYSEIQP